MRRVVATSVAAVSAVLVAALSSQVPARAAEVHREIAPGVELHAFTRIDPAGAQEVRVIRVSPNQPRVRIGALAASAFGSRRSRVSELVLRSGALAAVNGNFFLGDGDVRGILVAGGVVRSEPEAPVNGAPTPRAAWRGDGPTVAFGRPKAGPPGSPMRWTKPGDPFSPFGLNGVERATGYLGNPDEATLSTPTSGATSPPPPSGKRSTEVVLDGVPSLRFNTDLAATVRQVRSGPGAIPAGGAVVSAIGVSATQLLSATITAGDVVAIRLDIDDPAFAAATEAGGGGPWLLRGGQRVARADMAGEGFGATHLDARAPRTALGRTADGTVLLLTVDGRQPGRSVGASMAGLQTILLEQGATEAIALDGGGSTAMSVDGLVVNTPSGEDTTGQPGAQASVADGVGVFFDVAPVATRRVAGADRVGTAIELSKERPTADTVVLASTAGFADALVGAPLAATLRAPLLLTGAESLDTRVAAEIRRLGARTAVLLGGPAVLTPQVEAALPAAGLTSVRRVAGADRYETAARVAAEQPMTPTVVVASGERFPDALAAGALGLPVLLTTRGDLPAVTKQAIGSRTPVVVGGPAAVDPAVLPGAERVAGADRFATSAAVADWGVARQRYTPLRVVVARGDSFADAIVAGSVRRPLLLVDRFHLDGSPATRDWLQRNGGRVLTAALMGGRLALSTMVHHQVESAAAVPDLLQTAVGDLLDPQR